MPVITFYTNCKEEAGNTVSTVAFGTYLGIEESKKTLIISTGMNDDTMTKSLWPAQNKKMSGLFGPNTNMISQNGIEDLDRMVRSNRLTPESIQNYTRVALKGRLELLNGYRGSEEQYQEVQNDYVQVVTFAKKAYDNVLIDLDKNLQKQTKYEILNASDIVIALATQKLDTIQQTVDEMNRGQLLKKDNTLIAIGKYDEKSKYNAKNITRSYLKQSNTINTIPYNTLILEAIQEGKLIDVFWKFLNLKIKDENSFFVDELKRLKESTETKVREIQMKK